MNTHTATLNETAPSTAKLQRLQAAEEKRAADRKANPTAWKGWKLDAIARAAVPTFTRDEDGMIWA